MSEKPELVVDAAAIVGEGPYWASNSSLLWVDILGRKVFRFDPSTDRNTTEFEHPVENVAFVLEEADDGLLIGLNRSVHTLADGELSEPFVHLVDAGVEESLNDATIDPAGNLWVGTYENNRAPGKGSLWRVSPAGEAMTVLDGLTLPNGIGFSPDGTEMYVADSLNYKVLAFRVDLSTGKLTHRRELLADDANGLPDGLAVDVEGNVWVAFWGGSCVKALRSDGTEVHRVAFPVTQVASCAFAANGWLYATTARAFLDDDAIAEQPLAGGLFRVQVGVDGVPIQRFDRGRE